MSNIRRVSVKTRENGSLDHVAAFFDSTALYLVMWFPSFRGGESGTLYVRFRADNNDSYTYNNVPCDVMNELMNAESVGRKFSEIVKGKYEYIKH